MPNTNTSTFHQQNEVNEDLEKAICPWLVGFRLQYSSLIERWKLNGFFQEEDFFDINCHWLQFEPAPLVKHLILVCIFFLILLIGCFCNAVVVYILASSRHLRTPVNLLITNLAISDFIMLIKLPIFLFNSLMQGPALGSQGCKVYGFMSGLTGTTSIMSLAAIAVDRYLVIRSTININFKSTKTRAYIAAILVWIYSAVFATLPLFGIGRYVPEGYLTSCSFDYLSNDNKTRFFILSFFLAAWLVPFIVIVSCFLAVYLYVHKAKMELARQQWREQQTNVPVTRICTETWRRCTKDWIITKTIIGLVVIWMVSWTPYAFVALLGISGNQNRLSPGMTMLPVIFAKLSACVNPVVYILSNSKIRNVIARRWYYFIATESRTSEVAIVHSNAASLGRQGGIKYRAQISRLNTSSQSNGAYIKSQSSMSCRSEPTVNVRTAEPVPSFHPTVIGLFSIDYNLRSHTSIAQDLTENYRSQEENPESYREINLSVSPKYQMANYHKNSNHGNS